MRMRSKQERWRFTVDGQLKVIVASSRNVAFELLKKWYPKAKEILDAPNFERTDETIGRPVYEGEKNIVIAPPSPPAMRIPGLSDLLEDDEDYEDEPDGVENGVEKRDYVGHVSMPKRGRGRPKKVSTDSSEPKRGRGRPRKNPLPDPTAPKRKRGRPRIHPLPDPNAPKRKRGRPRKNLL